MAKDKVAPIADLLVLASERGGWAQTGPSPRRENFDGVVTPRRQLSGLDAA
jgi:hypothetical protein